MSDTGGPPGGNEPAPDRMSGMYRLRNYFLTGIVVVVPLFLTVYLTWAFILWVDSWVTPLIPALSSGMVSAFLEAWLRKPTYQDMLDLRHDTGTLRGWWQNRFARVIVNFVLTNTGTALATWIAGAKLIHGVG